MEPELSFFSHVRDQTSKHNVLFRPQNENHVLYGEIKCNGYFCPKKKTLAVAMSPQHWLQTLVHEYSHFEQWKTNRPAWTEAFVNGKDTSDIIDEWLGGKDFPKEEIADYIRRTRDCEHDCEKLALENITKFNLPLDQEAYAKRANAYTHFHNFMLQSRKWYTIGKEPYVIPEIIEAMNPTIDEDVSTTPEHVMELFRKLL